MPKHNLTLADWLEVWMDNIVRPTRAETTACATVASFQGVPLFDIGKVLGHATPATTGKIYTHLVDHTHEETLIKVSDALK